MAWPISSGTRMSLLCAKINRTLIEHTNHRETSFFFGKTQARQTVWEIFVLFIQKSNWRSGKTMCFHVIHFQSSCKCLWPLCWGYKHWHSVVENLVLFFFMNSGQSIWPHILLSFKRPSGSALENRGQENGASAVRDNKAISPISSHTDSQGRDTREWIRVCCPHRLAV